MLQNHTLKLDRGLFWDQ